MNKLWMRPKGLLAAEQESFADALQRVDRAARAVYPGDYRLFAKLWSHADDASLFGAFGPARVGWHELSTGFLWVASRYRDGTAHIDYVVVWEGVDSAYTIGYERAFVSIDGNEAAISTIRITHVYRREGGRWMLVHRQGDFAPVDESPRPTDHPG